jgi:uncharacterized protein (UPF0332 family)
MDGRAFLDVARELVRGKTEAHWRAAAGRAYYALLLETRDLLHGWGFSPPKTPRVHAFVRLRLVYATDLGFKDIGIALEQLNNLRNEADYKIGFTGRFASASHGQHAINEAAHYVTQLDQIRVDPKRSAAIAAVIRARWP